MNSRLLKMWVRARDLSEAGDDVLQKCRLDKGRDQLMRYIINYWTAHFDLPSETGIGIWIENGSTCTDAENVTVSMRGLYPESDASKGYAVVTGTTFRDIIEQVEADWIEGYMQWLVKNSWSMFNGSEMKDGKKILSGRKDAMAFNRSQLSILETLMEDDKGTGIIKPDIDRIFYSPRSNRHLPLPHAAMLKTHRIRPHELVVLAAWTGVGKSTYLVYLASYWVSCGLNVLLFSLEMPSDDMYELFYLTLNNNWLHPDKPISADAADSRSYTEEQKLQIDAMKNFDGGQFRVGFIPNLTSEGIEQQMINYQNELALEGRQLDTIMIDYAGLMQTASIRGQMRYDYTNYANQVIRDLKILTLKHNIPVITAFQLNRESQKRRDHSDNPQARRPRLYDLAYANETERSADRVMFLHTVVEDQATRDMEVIMAKSRKEPKGIYAYRVDMTTKKWSEGDLVSQEMQKADLDEVFNKFEPMTFEGGDE